MKFKSPTFWAVLFTGVWLFGLMLLLALKWGAFVNMDPNNWGDFLAGAFSPLGFAWLIAGYIQQGKELQVNTQALMLQHKEMEEQALQTRELALSAKQQAEVASQQFQYTLDLDKAAQLERRRQRIPIFIFEHFEGEMYGSYVDYTVTNTGGKALDIRIQSNLYDRAFFHNSTLLDHGDKGSANLGDFNGENEDPLIDLWCVDISGEEHHFIYYFEGRTFHLAANAN